MSGYESGSNCERHQWPGKHWPWKGVGWQQENYAAELFTALWGFTELMLWLGDYFNPCVCYWWVWYCLMVLVRLLKNFRDGTKKINGNAELNIFILKQFKTGSVSGRKQRDEVI